MRKNPNYFPGSSEPAYRIYHQTPPGSWDPEKTAQLANSIKFGVTLIPIGRAARLIFTACKALQAAKAIKRIPETARQVAEHAKNTGNAQRGWKGGRTFENDGRGGGQVLPRTDENGNAITYKEFDVWPFIKGQNRGSERVVVGSNNAAYYTYNHYQTFIPIR